MCRRTVSIPDNNIIEVFIFAHESVIGFLNTKSVASVSYTRQFMAHVIRSECIAHAQYGYCIHVTSRYS